MKRVIHPNFASDAAAIEECIAHFDTSGEMLGEAVRNTIKVFDLGAMKINVKSFRTPNAINRIIYRYIRKSKAQRSYEYANRLIELGIGTPQPIAYFENAPVTGLRESFYVSEQLSANLLFRELTTNPEYPNREQILRQYARFAFDLHEKKIEFIDNTSGNTLIVKKGDVYEFYLVDLNRMNFGAPLSLAARMENLAKLTTVDDIVRIISDEYAALYGKPEEIIYADLKARANRFQEQFVKRRKLKRKLKFWSKK